MTAEVQSPNRSGLASALRFLTELVAWAATASALWPVSWQLAVVAVLVLIALPTIFATPGDKPQFVVAVPGVVTIALVALHVVVAVVASWIAWPVIAAAAVTVLAGASVVTELPRWRWLAAH